MTEIEIREEEIQEKIAIIEDYKHRIEALAKEIELTSMGISEYRRALSTLENYKELKDEQEILVPIGGDSYIYARVTKPDNILMHIGANIVMTMNVSEGHERIDKKITTLEAREKSILQTIQNLEKQASHISAEVQTLYSELQKRSEKR